jgi:choline dehydrogenase-like flavoprotein
VQFVDRLSSRGEEVFARAVVLCASTVETTRLLLHSRTAEHPDGLGNASGTLGCYLMDHPSVMVFGKCGKMSPDRRFPLGGPHGALIPRYQERPRGYGVFVTAERANLAKDGFYTLFAICEMLPRRENRITLSADQTDRWGVPIPHIECAWGESELAMMAEARADLEEMAAAAGFTVMLTRESTPGSFVHEAGTARMGHDRATSFLNAVNQSWEIPNLFVADGSCFPTCGWQNPTLTMMALAARCGDKLARAMKEGQL